MIAIVLVFLSNVALVCRVTWTDKNSDKELYINVKGKSKGVYGVRRGLSITNESWRMFLAKWSL